MDRGRVVETVLLVRLRPTELVVPVIYCNCVDQSNGREVSDITRCKGSNYIIIFLQHRWARRRGQHTRDMPAAVN